MLVIYESQTRLECFIDILGIFKSNEVLALRGSWIRSVTWNISSIFIVRFHQPNPVRPKVFFSPFVYSLENQRGSLLKHFPSHPLFFELRYHLLIHLVPWQLCLLSPVSISIYHYRKFCWNNFNNISSPQTSLITQKRKTETQEIYTQTDIYFSKLENSRMREGRPVVFL